MGFSTKTIQIGDDLVKEFGKLGEKNYRKVLTRTQKDGSILTRVINSEGKQLDERLKQPSSTEAIGDKFVNTVTKESRNEDGSFIKRLVRDRVYSKALVEEQLADMRTLKELQKKYLKQHPNHTIDSFGNIKDELGFTVKDEEMIDFYKYRISRREPTLGERITIFRHDTPVIEKFLIKFQSYAKGILYNPNGIRWSKASYIYDFNRYSKLRWIRLGCDEFNSLGLPYPKN